MARKTDKPEPPQKSYQVILGQEVSEGLKELERSPSGLLISSFSAGLDLSFSLLLIGVMLTLTHSSHSELLTRILVANAYSTGFIFVILGRSELFTEHTTRAVYPVLTGHAPVSALLKLWVLIYIGNIAGTAVFAKLTDVIGPSLGVIDIAELQEFGRAVVAHSWWVILLSGVLAGWLMGLLSWLVTAGRETISQVFFVWLITAAIGLCHLHHAIVGSAEVLAAVFAGGAVPASGYGFFLCWASLGNVAGGVIFVAVLKYSHVMRGGRERAPVELPGQSGEAGT